MRLASEYKSFLSPVVEINDRVVRGFASIFGVVDDAGDIVAPGAFAKTIRERGKRIKFLWQHDSSQPPVARIISLREVKRRELPAELAADERVAGGLEVVREYLPTPRGDEILQGIKSGAITEMSFGYDVIKKELTTLDGTPVRLLKELALWDISDVNWGANALTVAQAKMAIRFRDYGLAPEDTPWEAPDYQDFGTGDTPFGELPAGERRRIAEHFAYSANWPPESYGDLKFPHHQPSRTGVGRCVWRAVANAMARLSQADIPDEDLEEVYRHLAAHYEQFGKEPPKMSAIAAARSILGATADDFKVGRMISAANLERIRAALAILQELLLSAEPPGDGDDEIAKALTEQLLIRQRMLEAQARYLGVWK